MRQGSSVVDRAPPSAPVDDEGGGGGWAWLVTTRGIIEAQLISGLLEAVGVVPVRLDTWDPSPSAWLFPFGNPNAPVAVFVPAAMLDTARLELLENGLAAPSAPEPQVRSRRTARAWVWIGISVVLLALLLLATLRGSVV